VAVEGFLPASIPVIILISLKLSFVNRAYFEARGWMLDNENIKL